MPRTELCTESTLDAGGFRPVQHMIQLCFPASVNGAVLRKNQNTGGCLCHRRIHGCFPGHRRPHHWSAGYNHHFVRCCSACHLNALGKRSSHRYLQDGRFSHFPCHSEIFLRKRYAFHCISHGNNSCHIVNNSSYIQRNSRRRNHLSGYFINNHLLITRRIKTIHQMQLHLRMQLLNSCCQCFDFFGICLFQGNLALRYRQFTTDQVHS